VDAAVGAGDDDVGAGHRRLGALRTEVPRETRLVVVGVGRAGRPEHPAGEPGLDGGDEPVELFVAGDVGQRVGVADVVGEHLLDQRAAGGGVGGVPGGQSKDPAAPTAPTLAAGPCTGAVTGGGGR
jgi:hypothetical protein